MNFTIGDNVKLKMAIEHMVYICPNKTTTAEWPNKNVPLNVEYFTIMAISACGCLQCSASNYGPTTILHPDWVSLVGPAAKLKDTRFPHTCPRCGNPAYIGFTAIECSASCR